MNKYEKALKKICDRLLCGGECCVREGVCSLLEPIQELIDNEKSPTIEEVKKEWEALGYSWEEDVYCIRLTNLKEDKVITFGFASKSYYCKCIKGYVHRSISFQEHQLLTKFFKALEWL